MAEADIKFEREGITGVVAVGTTLADAARRFGIRFDDCKPGAGHDCVVTVTSGAANLSPAGATETEHFGSNGRSSNDRLACEARIIKPGEIVIMTAKKTEEPKSSGSAKAKFQDEFNALPLDKKFAQLFQMEVATLNETFSYVTETGMKVIEKFGDAISDLGSKMESEAKKASEHCGSEPAAKEPKAPAAKSKPGAKRKPAAPRAPKA